MYNNILVVNITYICSGDQENRQRLDTEGKDMEKEPVTINFSGLQALHLINSMDSHFF